MDFLPFVVLILTLAIAGGIAMIIAVLNLLTRVKKLEQAAKTKAPQLPDESSSKPDAHKLEPQYSLLGRIEQQLRIGVSRDEITRGLIADGWNTSRIERVFSSIVPEAPFPDIPTTSKQAGSTPTTSSERVAIRRTSEAIDMYGAQGKQPPITRVKTGPSMLFKFIWWLKEDWLLKLGSVLLLIGFGWLTTYAYLNNWVGPTGRIGVGIGAGTAFMVLGWWRIKNYNYQGGIFLVLGSTTILLTVFAARSVYGFFSPATALLIMLASTSFVAFASVKNKNHPLALLSLLLAGVAPLLTKTPESDHVELFSYLLVVVIGTTWIVALTGQKVLTLVSILIVSLYSAPHLFAPHLFPIVNIKILLLFSYALAAVFFLTNTAGILKSKGKGVVLDLAAAAGTGLFILTWIMMAAQDEWKSTIIAGWMIVFAVGSFLIYKITHRREPFYVYAGIGMAMLAAATSAQFDGPTLTIAYIVETGIISLLAFTVFSNIRLALRLSLLLVAPVILSLWSMNSSAWDTGVLHQDFFVLLILGVTYLGLGLFFLRHVREDSDSESNRIIASLLVIGSVYFYLLLWLSLHAVLENTNTAVMLSLSIYTVIGFIFYFYGILHERTALKIYGGALVGFVIGRRLLIDTQNLNDAGQVRTLIALGSSIVSTLIFGKKKRVIIPLLLAPALLSIGSMTSRSWVTGVIHGEFFVLLILGITLLGLGLFFLRHDRTVTDDKKLSIHQPLMVVGSIYGYLLLWLSLHSALHDDDLALMISLSIYTAFGFIFYFYGLFQENRSLRQYGGALIAFVVGRRLVFDVWEMGDAGQISTVVLIGLAIACLALLRNRQREISLLLAGPLMLSIGSMVSPVWATSIFHQEFYVLLVLGVTTLGLGLYFSRSTRNGFIERTKGIRWPLIVVGSLYLYVLVWLCLHAKLQHNNAVMVALATYTVIGFIAFLYGLLHNSKSLQLYGAALVGFVVGRWLTVDVWMEHEGRIITFAVVFAAMASTTVLRRKERTITLFLIGPIVLSIPSIISSEWSTSVIHSDFFVLLALGMVHLWLGNFFLHHDRDVADEDRKSIHGPLLIIGSLYVYSLVWLALHAAFQNNNIAVMLSLVFFTIVGLITYFKGLLHGRKGLQVYGGLLVGFVVGRLVIFDVWDMEIGGRISTFFLIGALLVSTAFIGNKKREVDQSSDTT